MQRKIIGRDIPANDFQQFMEAWSLTQAEANHVETIEEANDFSIYDEEDDEIFPQNLTVYEMHEIQEELLQTLEEEQKALTGSNDPAAPGEQPNPQNAHAQSAPDDNAMSEQKPPIIPD